MGCILRHSTDDVALHLIRKSRLQEGSVRIIAQKHCGPEVE